MVSTMAIYIAKLEAAKLLSSLCTGSNLSLSRILNTRQTHGPGNINGTY